MGPRGISCWLFFRALPSFFVAVASTPQASAQHRLFAPPLTRWLISSIVHWQILWLSSPTDTYHHFATVTRLTGGLPIIDSVAACGPCYRVFAWNPLDWEFFAGKIYIFITTTGYLCGFRRCVYIHSLLTSPRTCQITKYASLHSTLMVMPCSLTDTAPTARSGRASKQRNGSLTLALVPLSLPL